VDAGPSPGMTERQRTSLDDLVIERRPLSDHPVVKCH
jgi:hypothetical protein